MENIPGHDSHFDPPEYEEGPVCSENPDHGPMEWDEIKFRWVCDHECCKGHKFVRTREDYEADRGGDE
jgi:hypothetical protein